MSGEKVYCEECRFFLRAYFLSDSLCKNRALAERSKSNMARFNWKYRRANDVNYDGHCKGFKPNLLYWWRCLTKRLV